MPHEQAEAIAPHVFYEWDRFTQAAQRIAMSQSAGDAYGVDLTLEAFLQHARNLLHFFSRDTSPRDDVFAIHFVDSWTCPMTELPYLNQHAKRLDRSIQHLSYSRITYGANREWPIDTIVSEMQAVWNRFWSELTPEQQEWFLRLIDPA